MSGLAPPLRRVLEGAIKQARTIAEGGARHALEALAVHEADPYRHMDAGQRELRKRLRAQAQQLGDGESAMKPGAYGIKHLAEKLAYDQWHRLLFARYLLENNLLISPEHGVSVSLDDCEELAPSLGLKDAWSVAARFAAKELPEIFRADDPTGAVELSVDDRKPLVALVTGLGVEVFTASDSLGWCYQYWQAEKKEEVNTAGNKIGADELPSVTQLFTEDYMVDFLLDNTLGAWHAGKVLAAKPELAEIAKSEDELRQSLALPRCPWRYLRFAQKDGRWTPAAGTFDGWPKTAKELKCLDPCMGSGHFVVAMFERLVALRLAEEKVEEMGAVAAVIRDNLFGLEIDPRCTQIAAFNLALAAWRRVGHCKLPVMHIACSGLAPNAKKDEWLKLAETNPNLRFAMGALYDLFQKAPVLGSLINPRLDKAITYTTTMHELEPLLEVALAQESKDAPAHEMTVTARGLANAAEILAGQYSLVATNVPFLGRGKQNDELQGYCERMHPAAKPDLATCFVERSLKLCSPGGAASLVTPQNWLFLFTYRALRKNFINSATVKLIAELGAGAFQTPLYDFSFALLITTNLTGPEDYHYSSLVASGSRSIEGKIDVLRRSSCDDIGITSVRSQSDWRFFTHEPVGNITPLSAIAVPNTGMQTNDNDLYCRYFWEFPCLWRGWEFFQRTSQQTMEFGGRELVLLWEGGNGRLREFTASQARDRRRDMQGANAWGKRGVLVHRMGNLPATAFTGELFDQNGAAMVPLRDQHLAALWCFLSSDGYKIEVRKLDNKVGVTPATLAKVPFDLAHWEKVAAEKYPQGLPNPFSSNPTQWLFNGHPAGADQPLHVAVARLLGYQWPRQTGSSFPDCAALDADDLDKLSDDDGIVPISPAKGEGPAAERLRELLARAYGKDWNASRQEELLAQADYAGASLEDWLRNGFFEQHCALFHYRPFIWHIWDGLKNGFSALVNYHKLTHARLEKLAYSYLGDWIRRQQAAVEAGESGSDAKLQAAKQLQTELKLILEGEPPYDIFVRWKPLSKQAIGWHPDLNDGVRMNIRPFMSALDVGKKGAGILRSKPNIKWEKDRGKEPERDKREFPWLWGWDEQKQDFTGVGKEPDGNRWNDCHYSIEFKQGARKA